jgi:hypothetical protein
MLLSIAGIVFRRRVRTRRRPLSLHPDCLSLENRTSLSIGGFNIGPVHVPALGTIINGGQAPPANVSTVGNPQPPAIPQTSKILITNHSGYDIGVVFRWNGSIASNSLTIKNNTVETFTLDTTTNTTLAPTIVFHPRMGNNATITNTLSILPQGAKASVISQHEYTTNNYHFAAQNGVITLYNGAN